MTSRSRRTRAVSRGLLCSHHSSYQNENFIMRNLLSLIGLIFTVLYLYGCGVIFSEPRGSLLLYKPVVDRPSSSYCIIDVVFMNQNASREMRPVVGLLFFDKGGNTLTSELLSFDSILAGKRQTKTVYLNERCQNVGRPRLEGVSDQNLGPDNWTLVRGVGFSGDLLDSYSVQSENLFLTYSCRQKVDDFLNGVISFAIRGF